MNKFVKSGADFTIFAALSFFKSNPYLQQFVIAIAGAIGVAFANYILIPLIKHLCNKVKSKIKDNDKIPDDIEDILIKGIEETEKDVTDKIKDLTKKGNDKNDQS